VGHHLHVFRLISCFSTHLQARDKALLLMERLHMVEPLVTRQPGTNLRSVRFFENPLLKPQNTAARSQP